MPRPVQAVLFDAVGTVLDPHPSVATAYYKAGRRFGSRRTREDVRQRFYRAFDRQEAVDREAGNRSTDEKREWQRWRAIVAEVFDDVPRGEELFQSLWDHFADADNWRLFDDVAATWDDLARRGLTLGVASNFDARLQAICRRFEPLAACPHIFVSSQLQARKPQREFFTASERALQLYADQILFVGDSLENDYRAALAAGWRAILLQHETANVPGEVTSIRSLTEVAEHLA